MSLDLHRARTFAEVVRLGSVSGAADALGYTQSAVSQQLSTLERDLGLTLVDRARRPLVPTPAGAELLPEVEGLLSRAAAVDAAVEDLRGLRRGHVQLAAFPSAITAMLPGVVSRFRADQPGVTVGLTQAETQPALSALRRGAADVALVHLMPGEELPADGELVSATVARDALRVVLPRDHPLAAERTVRAAQLAGEPLIVPGREGPGAAHRALVEQLVRGVRVAYEIDDLAGAQAFAAAGLGVVLMHGLTLRHPPPGVSVRPLAGRSGTRRVDVLRVRGRRVPAARALFEALAARPQAAEPSA